MYRNLNFRLTSYSGHAIKAKMVTNMSHDMYAKLPRYYMSGEQLIPTDNTRTSDYRNRWSTHTQTSVGLTVIKVACLSFGLWVMP